MRAGYRVAPTSSENVRSRSQRDLEFRSSIIRPRFFSFRTRAVTLRSTSSTSIVSLHDRSLPRAASGPSVRAPSDFQTRHLCSRSFRRSTNSMLNPVSAKFRADRGATTFFFSTVKGETFGRADISRVLEGMFAGSRRAPQSERRARAHRESVRSRATGYSTSARGFRLRFRKTGLSTCHTN